MYHYAHPSFRPPRTQQGAVLAVALVFLVILTLLGVIGMNTSILGTMMSSSQQFQTTALSQAEVVLNDGEDNVIAITTDGTPLDFNAAGDRYYDATATSTDAIDPSTWDWDGADDIFGTADDAFTTEAVTDADGNVVGHYVIQYGGLEPIPGNTGGLGGSAAYGGAGGSVAGSFVYVFLVTTQSDASRGARRIVQTVYVTENEP